jgi:hypothetical protein
MKPVQFMTTVHNDADFEAYREKDRTRRKKITNHEKELQEVPLRIPNPIDEYNQRMGYVDQHAQLESYYSVQQSHFRVWWPLFFFLLDATLVNVWILLRITGSTLLHRDMQVDLAFDLINEGVEELVNDPLKSRNWAPSMNLNFLQTRIATYDIPLSAARPRSNQVIGASRRARGKMCWHFWTNWSSFSLVLGTPVARGERAE